MAVAFTINERSFDFKTFTVFGTLVLTGNYGGGATNGDTLSFLIGDLKSTKPPLFVDIIEAPAAGTSATGNYYEFNPGTTLANGVLQVFAPGGAQKTQGAAYSAGELAAVLKIRATFKRL